MRLFLVTQARLYPVTPNGLDAEPFGVRNLGPFTAWTLDICVRPVSEAQVLCVVGLSDNSVRIFRVACGGRSEPLVSRL